LNYTKYQISRSYTFRFPPLALKISFAAASQSQKSRFLVEFRKYLFGFDVLRFQLVVEVFLLSKILAEKQDQFISCYCQRSIFFLSRNWSRIRFSEAGRNGNANIIHLQNCFILFLRICWRHQIAGNLIAVVQEIQFMLLNYFTILLGLIINNLIHLVVILLPTTNYHLPPIPAFPFLASLHAIIIQAHSEWYLNDLLVSRWSILTRFSELHLHSTKTLLFARILHYSLNCHFFGFDFCKRKMVFDCSVDWTISPCWDCYLLRELYFYQQFEFFAK